ncbi:GatB/YqeY domain-containing protein [Agrobacterium larrymoorei]|uniref:GatB/YqeY domain-containing protein n=1 Tax=Agrobacterium larrymoorei TaxID=160699 RepID=UPI00157266CB|nr:GatB/YqeY domain-containing protein [Agrobacterium larrymoorei]NTJ42897.1 GatB/YqeY domain-containing protein [Agrobacterium larrymoorei]
MIRDTFSTALKDAMKAKDSLRLATIRLAQAAIKDRDIANRGIGKEPVSDEEILQILAKMIKQREESSSLYEKAGRDELASQERDEIAIIKSFMPEEIPEEEVRGIIQDVIAETGAEGLRDMGKVMGVLKERYPGRIDFGKASGQIKDLLK